MVSAGKTTIANDGKGAERLLRAPELHRTTLLQITVIVT
jgi:hypothetical protein